MTFSDYSTHEAYFENLRELAHETPSSRDERALLLIQLTDAIWSVQCVFCNIELFVRLNELLARLPQRANASSDVILHQSQTFSRLSELLRQHRHALICGHSSTRALKVITLCRQRRCPSR